jgi:hypothetical protein
MRNRPLLATCAVALSLFSCQDASGPKNNPPHLRAIADQSLAAGERVEVEILATDPDGDDLTFSVLSNPTFISVESVTRTGDSVKATLVLAPRVAHAGSYTETVQVADGRGGEHSRVFSVEVIAPERGNWSGTADFGVLAFRVDVDRSTITQVHFLFQDWQCGVTIDGETGVDSPSGWPITAGEFTIENSFPAGGLSLTIRGTFTASDAASGTWSAVASGTACSGSWHAGFEQPPVGPGFGVHMSPDFSKVVGALGQRWQPRSQVTFEVDNGANGSVDYQRTGTTDALGSLDFRDYNGAAPFSVAEGDSVRMRDNATVVDYVVLYVTLDSVDLANDVLSGSAREGTMIDVRVFNPTLSFPQGPQITVTAGADARWTANFGGVFDIVANSSGWIATLGGAAHTHIDWRLPLGNP